MHNYHDVCVHVCVIVYACVCMLFVYTCTYMCSYCVCPVQWLCFVCERYVLSYLSFYPASTKPANVTADAVNPTTVDVAWTASTTVSTEYWIYYASGGGEDSGSAGVITGTSHTLGSLQDGLTYNITVIAVDGSHLPSEGVTVIVELERAGI